MKCCHAPAMLTCIAGHGTRPHRSLHAHCLFCCKPATSVCAPRTSISVSLTSLYEQHMPALCAFYRIDIKSSVLYVRIPEASPRHARLPWGLSNLSRAASWWVAVGVVSAPHLGHGCLYRIGTVGAPAVCCFFTGRSGPGRARWGPQTGTGRPWRPRRQWPAPARMYSSPLFYVHACRRTTSEAI